MPELLDKLKQAFQTIDASNDGCIDWDELQECCKTMSIKLDNEDKHEFLKCKLMNRDMVDFGGFCNFVKVRLQHIFNEIDLNDNGFIDRAEIEQTLEKLGINLSSRQIDSILNAMDRNNDQIIDFNEFCEFFSDIPSLNMQVITQRWRSGDGLDFGSDIVPVSMPAAEMPLFQFIMAGGIAGISSRTFTAPLEKVKLIAQTSTKGSERLTVTFSHVFRHEGMKGFFAGNLVNCIRVFPTSALVCLVYSRMIKYTPVDNSKNPHQPLWRFMSGVTAGVVSTTVTHPLDVVRARLTIQDTSVKGGSQYTGIRNAFTRIIAEEGVIGLYKGLGPSLLSIAPFLGIQQSTYDIMKIYAADTPLGASSSTFMLCGALAGVIAQTTVHPLDVVRRRMQIAHTPSDMTRNFAVALKDLWVGGGTRAIYAGLTASYLKVMPAAASSLLVRDFILGRVC